MLIQMGKVAEDLFSCRVITGGDTGGGVCDFDRWFGLVAVGF